MDYGGKTNRLQQLCQHKWNEDTQHLLSIRMNFQKISRAISLNLHPGPAVLNNRSAWQRSLSTLMENGLYQSSLPAEELFKLKLNVNNYHLFTWNPKNEQIERTIIILMHKNSNLFNSWICNWRHLFAFHMIRTWNSVATVKCDSLYQQCVCSHLFHSYCETIRIASRWREYLSSFIKFIIRKFNEILIKYSNLILAKSYPINIFCKMCPKIYRKT